MLRNHPTLYRFQYQNRNEYEWPRTQDQMERVRRQQVHEHVFSAEQLGEKRQRRVAKILGYKRQYDATFRLSAWNLLAGYDGSHSSHYLPSLLPLGLATVEDLDHALDQIEEAEASFQASLRRA